MAFPARFIAVGAFFVFGAPSIAQTSPKTVKTQRVEAAGQPLFTVEADGSVRFDWRRVEAVARSADLTDRDAARALMAVRDCRAERRRALIYLEPRITDCPVGPLGLPRVLPPVTRK